MRWMRCVRPALRLLAAMTVLAALAACAGRPTRPGGDLPPLRLSPASLQSTLALQQQLHFRFGRVERDLDALLEADDAQVQLLVQAMGQTGFRVRWDGQHLDEQRRAPERVEAERLHPEWLTDWRETLGENM